MANTDNPRLPLHPEVRYERTDIHAGYVALAGAGILLGTWFAVAALYPYYALLTHFRAAERAPVSERAAGQRILPPEPRLETRPEKDLAQFRAMEQAQLDGYGWADRQQGTVTIPIERAMDLIVQRGIPPQQAPANLNLVTPSAGTRQTGLEGKVGPESR